MERDVTRRGFLAASTALVLSGCSTPPVSDRQRLTLIVDTPDGQISGSGVVEKAYAYQDGWLSGMSGLALVSSKRGEAVTVDLRERGLLFALLRDDQTRKPSFGVGDLAAVGFPQIWASADRGGGSAASKRYITFCNRLNTVKPKATIPLSILPLLVFFTDPDDPSTVERVDPFDLSPAFGPGVKLLGATVEIVDAPITKGIEKRLPWLELPRETVGIVKYPGPMERQGKDLEALQYKLTTYDFWEGMS